MDFNVQQSIEVNGIRYRENRRTIRYMNCRTILTKREIEEDSTVCVVLSLSSRARDIIQEFMSNGTLLCCSSSLLY